LQTNCQKEINLVATVPGIKSFSAIAIIHRQG